MYVYCMYVVNKLYVKKYIRTGRGVDMTEATRSDHQHGVYYTLFNPFDLAPFRAWADAIDITRTPVLEPFAGSNNLIWMLKAHHKIKSKSYDISPAGHKVAQRDTLNSFPAGYRTAISNPPWLDRSSATVRNMTLPPAARRHNNLWKYSLELALNNCENVCFLLPATFLVSGEFRDRLHSVIFIHRRLFAHTESPTCMAMFTRDKTDPKLYHNNKFIGTLGELSKYYPKPKKEHNIIFSVKNGNIGVSAYDDSRHPTICFLPAENLGNKVSVSDRLIMKLWVDLNYDPDIAIARLNRELKKFRKNTKDVFLTPMRRLREDGVFCQCIRFNTIRDLINAYC